MKAQYTDVSAVKKFEITTEEYNKLPGIYLALTSDSVRAYKERNKIGRFADIDPEQEALKQEEFAQEASLIAVGNRCVVDVSSMEKRATVKFVGKTEFKLGYWVGVEYDEPVGKNNGTVQGKQYFACTSKHGAMVRPGSVTVGDYPEEDLFGSDDEM